MGDLTSPMPVINPEIESSIMQPMWLAPPAYYTPPPADTWASLTPATHPAYGHMAQSEDFIYGDNLSEIDYTEFIIEPPIQPPPPDPLDDITPPIPPEGRWVAFDCSHLTTTPHPVISTPFPAF